MSSNWNKASVGSLHLDDGVSEGFADDEGNKDGLDVGILEGSSDDDGPDEGRDESEDGMDDEEGPLDGVELGAELDKSSTQQMRRARSSVEHTE
jgi:hypothetical protein